MTRPISDWFNEKSMVRSLASQILNDTLAWDEYDDVANAIIALVRTQNRIQSLHNAEACDGDVPDQMLDGAYAAREKAVEQLLAAHKAFKGGNWWK
jgi:hypothetical protein